MGRFLICLLLLMQSFISLADTPMGQEKCKDLAVDLSIVDFSPDRGGNSVVYDRLGLNNKLGYKYIDDTRMQLKDKLQAYCVGSPTIESMIKAHHAECSQVCQDNATALFKKPLFGENQKKLDADTACLMVCNRSQNKLSAMLEGATLAKKNTADCSGQVSNHKRGSKPTILDGALDVERSFSDTSKTKAK